MLTISQLARYVGVTVRAVRHYHQVGLLPEPDRSASGYRSYGADDIVALRRIKVLTDAGVPLARVRNLLDADAATLAAAVADLDRELRARIAALRATRRALAALADADEPFLPPDVARLHARLRALGLSERTLALEREGWILTGALYPDLVGEWLALQQHLLDNPEYVELYLLTEQCMDWAPDDPRIEDLAHRTVDLMARLRPPDSSHWEGDRVAFELVTAYRTEVSAAWKRCTDRVQELMVERGYSLPG